MPSLNVVKYIDEAISSVLAQTLNDIEILCVDAGSSDGTLEKIIEYEKKDNRLKLILSDKKSYGYQINLGIDAASGEYIGIVETDDFILPDMYRRYYHTAHEMDLDLIKSDFYRFTGDKGEYKKILYELGKDKDYYNRVIDVSKEQGCFRLVMNTWCGIYKTDYLNENNIRLNESAGASFQDNGFWFQTLMYAKRALFSEEAFYMNRRDNTSSSVFDRSKVFCVPDEYKYIYNVIKKNKLEDLYGNTFIKACYKGYMAALSRVDRENIKELIRRFSDDFRYYSKEGILDLNHLPEKEHENIEKMLADHEKYCAEYINKYEKTTEKLKQAKNIIIYGAGLYGKNALKKILSIEKENVVVGFAVTDITGQSNNYMGYHVFEIGDLAQYKDTAVVVIGVKKDNQEAIYRVLQKLGFMNVISYFDIL